MGEFKFILFIYLMFYDNIFCFNVSLLCSRCLMIFFINIKKYFDVVQINDYDKQFNVQM